jgi:hypothetical protein
MTQAENRIDYYAKFFLMHLYINQLVFACENKPLRKYK